MEILSAFFVLRETYTHTHEYILLLLIIPLTVELPENHSVGNGGKNVYISVPSTYDDGTRPRKQDFACRALDIPEKKKKKTWRTVFYNRNL